MSVPAAFLGVIVIWSTTPLSIQWSTEGGHLLFGVAARMVIGVLICLLVARLMKLRLPWHRPALYTYAAGALGVYGGMLSVYWGAQYIPSGLISVLFGLSPLFTGVLAALWLNESSLTPSRIIGLLAALAGLTLIFETNGSDNGDSVLGILAVLFAALLHAISGVTVKRIGAGLPALNVTTGALLLAVPLYVLTWAWFDGGMPEVLTPRAVSATVYLGVMGSAFGFFLYYYALKHAEASRVGLIPLVTPVCALLLGQWLNGEQPTGTVWAGTALILSGLAFYEWGQRALRRLARR